MRVKDNELVVKYVEGSGIFSIQSWILRLIDAVLAEKVLWKFGEQARNTLFKTQD